MTTPKFGSTHNSFFSIDGEGRVSGIEEIHTQEGKSLTMEKLKDYNYLEKGKTLVLDEEQDISVVEFGAYWSQAGMVSTLSSHEYKISKDAVLTGPLTWKTIELDKKPVEKQSDASSFVMLAILLAGYVGVGYINLEAGLALAGTSAMVVGIVSLFYWRDSRKRNRILKQKSARFLNPSTRSWA